MWQFERAFRGYVVRHYRPIPLNQDPSGCLNALMVGKLCQWADLIFCDYAQSPFQYALGFFPSKYIVVRVNRIEIYSEEIYYLDWNAVDLVIFTAEHVKQRFFEKLEAVNANRALVVNRPMRSVVIPGNMYDPEQFKFNERAFKKPYRICIAGHLVPKKRQYTLVQMMADLPPYFTLDMAGGLGMPGYGNPEYPQNIRDLIEILGLQDRVKLVGELPYRKMAEFYRAHDIIVSNSNEEGDALNVTEAAATGCYPVINAWRGAAQHYGEEYIFKTPKEFANRLMEWAHLPQEEKLRLSRKAAADMARFQIGPLSEKMRELLREVASKDKVQAYYDHTLPEDVFQGRNERIVAIEGWVKDWLKPGMRVLSLGCGIGLVEESLAETGVEVLGVDISGAKIENAQARTQGKPHLRFVQGDATDPEIGFVKPPQFFEAVLMNDFIEHIRLEDQEKVWDIVDQLCPEGLVLVNMPSPAAPRGGRTPQPIDELVEPDALLEALVRHGFSEVLLRGLWLQDFYFRLVVSR